jgi:hypothetical protein
LWTMRRWLRECWKIEHMNECLGFLDAVSNFKTVLK